MSQLCPINVTKFVREIHQAHTFTLKNTRAFSDNYKKQTTKNITYSPATNEIGYKAPYRYIWCSPTLNFFKG